MKIGNIDFKDTKRNRIIGASVSGLIIIIMIVSLSGGNKNENQLPPIGTNAEPPLELRNEEPSEPEEPIVEDITPKPLNVRVRKAYDFPGIEITNNDKIDWDNCELTLNGSYSRSIRNPLEPKAPLNNPYGLFTDPYGDRFDQNSMTAESFSISCDVNGETRDKYVTF